jgi:hypothetical protein
LVTLHRLRRTAHLFILLFKIRCLCFDKSFSLLFTHSTIIYSFSLTAGGVSELAQHLKDDQVQYAIVRIPEKKDIANATRDIFITWWGPKHPKIKCAKKRTHHADVKKVMQPSHAEIEVINKANFNEETVRERSNPGSGSHVID